MNNRLKYILAMSGAIGFETLSQIAMKFAARHLENIPFGIEWLEHAVMLAPIWFSLLCDLCNFFCWMVILRGLALSFAFPISSLCYVTVAASGYFIFAEELPFKAYAGILLIMAGTAIIGLGREKS